METLKRDKVTSSMLLMLLFTIIILFFSDANQTLSDEPFIWIISLIAI